ncbi:MAG: hypothetical protein HOV81_38955 [Kofleriaceae bacterium]|nr:hypothetical protein [Kofleriaceae bacterium]
MQVAALVGMRAAPILLLFLISTACAKERDREKPASRERARPESTLTGTLPKQMRNCPSAVPSAKTSAVPTDKGVDVVITAPELDARHRILALAELHASQREPIAMLGEHNGMHGGPGTMGRCPIIHANTTVKLDPIPEGVRIHVTANDKDDIQALQKATDARVKTLQLPSS